MTWNDPGGNAQRTNSSADLGAGNQALDRHAAAMGCGSFAASLPGESIDDSLAIELDTFNDPTA